MNQITCYPYIEGQGWRLPVEHLFSRLWSDWPFTSYDPWAFEYPFPGDHLALDLYETKNDFVIEAAIPGVRPKGIDIEVSDNYLTIRSSQELVWQDNASLKAGYHTAYQRTLRLPEGIQTKKAKAELKNGVLQITLPKQRAIKRSRSWLKLPKFQWPILTKRQRVKIKHR